MEGHAEVVWLLLFELGADASALNNQGLSPKEVAREERHDGVIRVIQETEALKKEGSGDASCKNH